MEEDAKGETRKRSEKEHERMKQRTEIEVQMKGDSGVKRETGGRNCRQDTQES